MGVFEPLAVQWEGPGLQLGHGVALINNNRNTFLKFYAPDILVEKEYTWSSVISSPDVRIFITKYNEKTETQ